MLTTAAGGSAIYTLSATKAGAVSGGTYSSSFSGIESITGATGNDQLAASAAVTVAVSSVAGGAS